MMRPGQESIDHRHQHAIQVSGANALRISFAKRGADMACAAPRMFLRMALTSGGAPKNSGYKPVMSELKFNVDTYLPKVIDHNDFLKIDLCEKPDSGPGKALAYYKAPMPKVIDYPIEMKQVPLFGSSGFFQGTPVGRMALSFRILSEPAFQDWKQSIEDYDPEAHKKKEDKKLKEDADKPKAVAEKVMERVIEYAITHLLDFYGLYKELKTLDLSHCTGLTDYSVIEVVRSMPHLHTINLDGVVNITDESLLYIGRLCPNLKQVTSAVCVFTRSAVPGPDLACAATSLPSPGARRSPTMASSRSRRGAWYHRRHTRTQSRCDVRI